MSFFKLVVSVFLLSSAGQFVSAQEMTCREKVQKLLIDKVRPYDSKYLIPYYSEKDNQWGFFDRKTGKIVTKPILRRDAVFFNPSLDFDYTFETDGLENGCTGEVAGSRDNYQIVELENSGYEMFKVAYDPNSEENKTPIFINKIKNSISGFEVDEKGNLTNFNSKYYDAEKDEPLILETFPFKENYYGIAKSTENGKTYFSVIKQDGTEFSNFKKLEFYPKLKTVFSKDTDIWFMIKTNDGKFTYKSLFGNKTIPDFFDEETVYGHYQGNILGYVIYSVNKNPGVFDLTTMKWKIKPSKKNDFHYIEFASSEKLLQNSGKFIPSENIENNRKNSFIYLQSSKNEFYDLDLKLYKPKR